MCLSPKWIYKKGRYKSNNYRGLEGEPYELGTYSKCGSCSICINEKMNNWVIRCTYEARKYKEDEISFITLTYKDNPIILVKKDLQDFIKRLRINLKRSGFEGKIRYFACGEYGTINGRPHFHVLIYGWTDPKAYYVDVSKKSQIVLRSDFIEKTWGKGITSYQTFRHYEIPYIAIYETPQENFKRAYKLSREKVKKLEALYQRTIKDRGQKDNVLAELQEARREMEEEKKEYVLIKEFNTWSIALGWDEFEKEYDRERVHDFKVYIEDKEFVVPSPWVKKMANMGDIDAANEMLKREREIQQSATEEQEAWRNKMRVEERRKREMEKWIDTKDKVGL